MPTRVGSPREVIGLSDTLKSPIYATGVGLVLYGARHARLLSSGRGSYPGSARVGSASFSRLGDFMKSIHAWFARHMGV
jgi:cell division ATPase FtsA